MGADTLDFFWASFWAPPLLDLDLVELEEDLDELPEDFFDLFFVSPIAGHKCFGPVEKKLVKDSANKNIVIILGTLGAVSKTEDN